MDASRRWFAGIPLFPRLLLTGGVLLVAGGGVWGFLRGLHHLPTLWAAIIEGAVIVVLVGALPVAMLAAVITGVVHLVRRGAAAH